VRERADREEGGEGLGGEGQGGEGGAVRDGGGGRAPCTHSVASKVVADFIGKTEEAVEAAVGSKTIREGISRKWFDGEAREAVGARRVAYAAWRVSPSETTWAAFKEKRGMARAVIRRKRQQDWQDFVEKVGTAHNGDTKLFYSLVRRFMPKAERLSAQPVLKQDGSMATSEEDILEEWADYQERLGAPSPVPRQDAAFEQQVAERVRQCAEDSPDQPETELDGEFSEEEVFEATEALQFNKASGIDGTKNEMFKCGGEPMGAAVGKLMNWLRRNEFWPADWQQSVVQNLFKEGDKADQGNYRGISLISCLGKLYISLWARRLTKHVECRLDQAQGGFRPGRSTTDQILALHEELLRRKKAKKKTFLYFVDFRKAFDTMRGCGYGYGRRGFEGRRGGWCVACMMVWRPVSEWETRKRGGSVFGKVSAKGVPSPRFSSMPSSTVCPRSWPTWVWGSKRGIASFIPCSTPTTSFCWLRARRTSKPR
jgi:hypothetical protein